MSEAPPRLDGCPSSLSPRPENSTSGKLSVRGARVHNLKNVDLDIPRDSLVVFTGLSRLGQVEPRVRHDLRRGPAPLRRVAERLRPPVPRPGRPPRRRLHRGPEPRGVDRPEVDQPQPAVDGRHDHRDPRLHAPAVGAHRRAALPRVRRGHPAPDGAADRRPAHGAARAHPVPDRRARRHARRRASSSTSSRSSAPRATRARSSTAS